MRKLFYIFLLIFSLVSASRNAMAQDFKKVRQQTFTDVQPADTVYIKKLINAGMKLRWIKPDSSMALLQKAETLSTQIHYINGIAKSLMNMGITAMSQDNYKQSYIYYQQAYPYCKISTNKSYLTTLFINIGTTYYYQGLYDKAAAVEYFTLQYLKQRNIIDANYAILYANIAAVMLTSDQYQKALDYTREGEAVARKYKLYNPLTYILNNKGTAYQKLNQPQLAYQNFSEALEISRQHKFKEEEQAQLNSLGDLMLDANQPEKALSYFEQSLRVSDSTNPLFGSIQPNYHIGLVQLKLKNYQKAEEALRKAESRLRQSGIHDNEADIYEAIADLYEQTGRYKEALEKYHVYTKLKDSLLSKDKMKAIAQIEMKYNSAQKDKSLAEKQLLINTQQNELQQKNIWIAIAAGSIALLFLFIIGIYRNYRNKQKIQSDRIHILQQQREILQLKSIMHGEEQERTRLARELHDGIGGMLAAIRMHLSMTQKRAADGKNVDAEPILHMIDDTITEVRKTAHNLMPDILLRHGLIQSLRIYCANISSGTGLHVDLQVHNEISAFDTSVELHIYRIVQELIQNIIKHAQATDVTIQIRQLEDALVIMVEDNGTGFDTDEAAGGIGMKNLQSRVQTLQGIFSVESEKDHGTTTYIEFNLHELLKTATV
ncbi:tetratricopeptide repeat-containing sensor histidine kinase [Taibaiella soli]|uniref:histidine kinase n=1 Tax=Taibaiella soli TaxID=1649169 RepID=A0A2W2C3A0_9BACT|nr:tetratricopeptide repeat protein [Taibaiella soli]PZF74583.1 hypothetical protein DN068_03125 [Taibaiella soli]